MTVDMVPQLIKSGFRAIAVQFDVWGVAKLMHSSLTEARGYSKEFENNPSAKDEAVANGHTKPE